MPFRCIVVAIDKLKILFESQDYEHLRCIESLFRYHLCKCDEEGKEIACNHRVFIQELIPHSEASHNLCRLLKESRPVWKGKYCEGSVRKNIRKYETADGERELYDMDSQLYVIHNRHKKESTCYIKGKSRKNGLYLFKRSGSLAIFLAHTICGMYKMHTVHASCVEINGGAYLFLGQSGMGKTTLCHDLVERGYSYMGDDLVFLQEIEGKIVVHSWLCPAKVCSSEKGCAHKETVDYLLQPSTHYSYSSPLKGIFHLQKTENKESAREAVPPISIFTWLIDSSNNLSLQYQREAWISTCQEAALSIPGYTLFYGNRSTFPLSLILDNNDNCKPKEVPKDETHR